MILYKWRRNTFRYQYKEIWFLIWQQQKITDENERKISKPDVQSNDSNFLWNKYCSFCERKLKHKKRKKAVRQVISFVSNEEFTGTVLNIRDFKDFRDDYFRKTFRIQLAEIDVVTLNASYHKRCYNALQKTKKKCMNHHVVIVLACLSTYKIFNFLEQTKNVSSQ